MFRADAYWLWDDSGATYVNSTNNLKVDTAVDFLADVNDAIYIGFSRRLDGFYSQVLTGGSYSGLTFSYWNGETWSNLVVTRSYDFSSNGHVTWIAPDDWYHFNFSDTVPHSATPPDQVERYWVRITASTVTTAAVISKLRVIPFATYASPDELRSFLSLAIVRFTHSTTPSVTDAEKLLRRAEDRIDYRTKRSWRFNVVTDELMDYNRHGICLRRKDIIELYSAYIWTGNAWQSLIEGRDQDYFLEPERGMVYFARLFILPALYAPVGRYSWWWGYGEYKMNVKMNYSWGRDPETDPQFQEVKELALKLAAVDFYTNLDFTTLAVSGADRVDFATKIAQWREDVESKLSELESIFTW